MFVNHNSTDKFMWILFTFQSCKNNYKFASIIEHGPLCGEIFQKKNLKQVANKDQPFFVND